MTESAPAGSESGAGGHTAQVPVAGNGGPAQASQSALPGLSTADYVRHAEAKAAYAENVKAAEARNAQWREIEAADRKMGAEAGRGLRIAWGTESRANGRLVDQYIRGLPTDKQDFINDKINAAETPEQVQSIFQALAILARGGGSAAPAKPITEELAQIRERMRKDRAGYNRDERMQARYRDLIAARDGDN